MTSTHRQKRKSTGRKRQPKKLSRLHKPKDMSLEAWQVELRRQFGREQKFKLTNVGAHPIFSDFQVANPQSKSLYNVAIRGAQLGDNFCTCPDFITNTLGTCKHIEFTLAKLGRQNGAAALRESFAPPYSEVHLRYGAQREVRFRPGGDCPADFLQLARRYFDADGVLRADAFGRFEEFLAGAGNIDHALHCSEDVLGFIAELRDRRDRHDRLEKAFAGGVNSPTFDKLLKVKLYEYQREGALFAARVGRCLIGDEMGLGKTIQAIAAAEIMAREFGVERVLVVCPTSLKHQWEREIARFADRSAQVVGGLRARREQDYACASFSRSPISTRSIAIWI